MVSRVPLLQRHYPPSPLLNPSYTLSPFGRLPGGPGYTAYLSPVISARGEEGFSLCPVRPCLRAVANHPAGAVHLFSQPVSMSRAAFARKLRARPPVLTLSRPPRVHLVTAPAARSPPRRWLCRMSYGSSVSLLSVIPVSGLWLLPWWVISPPNEPSFRVAQFPEVVEQDGPELGDRLQERPTARRRWRRPGPAPGPGREGLPSPAGVASEGARRGPRGPGSRPRRLRGWPGARGPPPGAAAGPPPLAPSRPRSRPGPRGTPESSRGCIRGRSPWPT